MPEGRGRSASTRPPCRRRGRRAAAILAGPAAALAAAALVSGPAVAETATVAVAANFLAPARMLETAFESATPHEVTLVSASTGQLYAQIANGAPFDVLLAADTRRPRLLAENGLGVAASRFTYAVGRLALWTRDPGFREGLSLEILGEAEFRWLAIANPHVAPYGAAAREALEALELWGRLEPRIVRGQNVGQAFVMARSGNAELALVALSQVRAHEGPGAHVVVPADLHAPLRQDAILLARAGGNPAAAAFLDFLRGPAAAKLVERYGYFSGAPAP